MVYSCFYFIYFLYYYVSDPYAFFNKHITKYAFDYTYKLTYKIQWYDA